MEYFVYFLKREKNGDIYVGSTSDVSRRVAIHNAGKVKSTKGYGPWKLFKFLKYASRSEAVKAELFIRRDNRRKY